MNDYYCSRCNGEINTNPNTIMTDKGISWSLCDNCYKDLCSFLSPGGYRYHHQKSEEALRDITAEHKLFDKLHELRRKLL